MPLQKPQARLTDNADPIQQIPLDGAHSPRPSIPQQAPFIHGSAVTSPPMNQGSAAYFPPNVPPAAHFGPAPAYGQPQDTPSSSPHTQFSPPPGPHPQMSYQPPPPQQQFVFLGFHNTLNSSKAVYGPPGAEFDNMGNVYIQHPDGEKEWIGQYKNYYGEPCKNPNQRREEDCCWTIFGIDQHNT